MIEYKQLIGNIEEMISIHKTLASNLEEESPSKKTPREQRLGKVLLGKSNFLFKILPLDGNDFKIC